jgi:hypothetical protein
MKDDKTIFYKLLYQTLIEIRERAHEIEDKKIFVLSDMMHNLPMMLLNERNSYENLIGKIEGRAEGHGAKAWLDNAMRQL